MDRSFCAELDRFSHSLPYHRIVLIKNPKTLKETVNKLKKPSSFTFENIKRQSLELNFKQNTSSLSPDCKKRPSSSSNKANDMRRYSRYKDIKLTPNNFKSSQEAFNKIRIHGSSAKILKKHQDFIPSFFKSSNQNYQKLNTIRVKIKSVRHSTYFKP